MTVIALRSDARDIPAYYAEVAHRFEELADYVRSHPELDRSIADHLNCLAGVILSDVGHQDHSKVPTALLAYSAASRLSGRA